MTVIIHQIPNHLELAICGAAGKSFEMFTVGGNTFDGVKAIRLRQPGVESRAKFNVISRGIETELAKVAGHDGNGRASAPRLSAIGIIPGQFYLQRMLAGRVINRVPDQQAISVRSAAAFLNFCPAVGREHRTWIQVGIQQQKEAMIGDGVVADRKFKGESFWFIAGENLAGRHQFSQ